MSRRSFGEPSLFVGCAMVTPLSIGSELE